MTEEFAIKFFEALKHPIRAAIFYQLIQYGKVTATQISKNLKVEVDKIYYHLKILREKGIVGEPESVVRGNYVEKYYKISQNFKDSLVKSGRELAEKEMEIPIEVFRELALNVFSVVQSIISGSVEKIKNLEDIEFEKIRRENSLEAKIIFCPKDEYFELLEKVREITRRDVENLFEIKNKEYVILAIAIPKL